MRTITERSRIECVYEIKREIDMYLHLYMSSSPPILLFMKESKSKERRDRGREVAGKEGRKAVARKTA